MIFIDENEASDVINKKKKINDVHETQYKISSVTWNVAYLMCVCVLIMMMNYSKCVIN